MSEEICAKLLTVPIEMGLALMAVNLRKYMQHTAAA
jgi:hypothetical protein